MFEVGLDQDAIRAARARSRAVNRRVAVVAGVLALVIVGIGIWLTLALAERAIYGVPMIVLGALIVLVALFVLYRTVQQAAFYEGRDLPAVAMSFDADGGVFRLEGGEPVRARWGTFAVRHVRAGRRDLIVVESRKLPEGTWNAALLDRSPEEIDAAVREWSAGRQELVESR